MDKINDGYHFEKLINAVKLHEQLYNKTYIFNSNNELINKEFRYKNLVGGHWLIVSKITGISIMECKKQWNFLLDKFIREYKRPEIRWELSQSEWHYYQQMLFLGDYLDGNKPRFIIEEYQYKDPELYVVYDKENDFTIYDFILTDDTKFDMEINYSSLYPRDPKRFYNKYEVSIAALEDFIRTLKNPYDSTIVQYSADLDVMDFINYTIIPVLPKIIRNRIKITLYGNNLELKKIHVKDNSVLDFS